MVTPRHTTRRSFLRGAAGIAAASTLAACSGARKDAGGPGDTKEPTPDRTSTSKERKGSATEPLKPPQHLREVPALKKRVKAGDLPNLAQRLPARPYVVPHNWIDPGKYGGRLRMTMSATDSAAITQYMYGHSPLRWLNDGLDIGPGLAESWESNSDGSQWTLHFREGLKWSDGAPWTTADIMYWWEAMVLNDEHPAVPPEVMYSSQGNLAKLTAPDDFTVVLKFDSPAPLVPNRLANFVNRGRVGPAWMQPKHYLKHFHPAYNHQITSKSWYEKHDGMADWAMNPGCPTMTGWRLKSYHEGRNLVFERNPFYYAVAKDGAQLPYLDEILITAVQSPEVQRLQYTQGKVDYVHGGHSPVALSDVEALKRTDEKSGLRVWFWDSGTGGESCFFFNWDWPEPRLRKLIRQPDFMRALSHGFNRREAQKTIWFDTGHVTTGTISPKCIEFNINKKGKDVYRDWRDSYIEYDPDKAGRLLDGLGVVDKDGDGWREFPGGEKLELSIDYSADANPIHIEKNNRLKQDWEKVGIKAQVNPIPPTSFDTQWKTGQVMSQTTRTLAAGPDFWTIPRLVVPIVDFDWAPLAGGWYQTRNSPDGGTELDKPPYERTPPRREPEPDSPVARLFELYDDAKAETDALKRHRIAWEIVKVHIEEGPFILGAVANPPRIVLVHEDLQNVPRHGELAQGGFIQPWNIPSPAVYDPEVYYWQNPANHGS